MKEKCNVYNSIISKTFFIQLYIKKKKRNLLFKSKTNIYIKSFFYKNMINILNYIYLNLTITKNKIEEIYITNYLR